MTSGSSVAGWCLLGIVLAASTAEAQRRYQPAYGPTMSPYLQYLNPNPGPINRYYSYIQPQRQMQQTLRDLQTSLQQQQAGLNTLAAQSQFQTPTGSASTYLNYSHYYQGFGPAQGLPAGGAAAPRAAPTRLAPRRSGLSGGRTMGRSFGLRR